MKKKLLVQTAVLDGEQVILGTEDGISGMVPSGQMLVDSDGIAFIYLLESNSEYTYLVLPESVWPVIKEGLEFKKTFFIENGGNKTELANFKEELEYLIANIKGNSNYGDEMVTKVESTF